MRFKIDKTEIAINFYHSYDRDLYNLSKMDYKEILLYILGRYSSEKLALSHITETEVYESLCRLLKKKWSVVQTKRFFQKMEPKIRKNGTYILFDSAPTSRCLINIKLNDKEFNVIGKYKFSDNGFNKKTGRDESLKRALHQITSVLIKDIVEMKKKKEAEIRKKLKELYNGIDTNEGLLNDLEHNYLQRIQNAKMIGKYFSDTIKDIYSNSNHKTDINHHMVVNKKDANLVEMGEFFKKFEILIQKPLEVNAGKIKDINF